MRIRKIPTPLTSLGLSNTAKDLSPSPGTSSLLTWFSCNYISFLLINSMVISDELSPYPSKFSSLFKAISKPLFAKTSPENIKSMPNMHRIIDFSK